MYRASNWQSIALPTRVSPLSFDFFFGMNATYVVAGFLDYWMRGVERSSFLSSGFASITRAVHFWIFWFEIFFS
jgi:hypothetical protein